MFKSSLFVLLLNNHSKIDESYYKKNNIFIYKKKILLHNGLNFYKIKNNNLTSFNGNFNHYKINKKIKSKPYKTIKILL